MTTKQRCGTIGGILISIGLLLCLIGNGLNSHNWSLYYDYENAKSYFDDANRQLSAPHIVSENQQREAINNASRYARKFGDADRRLRSNSYPPELINLLFGAGGFLLMLGFVLMVVGWVIVEDPAIQKDREEKQKQKNSEAQVQKKARWEPPKEPLKQEERWQPTQGELDNWQQELNQRIERRKQRWGI